MTFEDRLVPYNWVQIVDIRNKDGSSLAADNWRNALISVMTICWVAGGLTNPTPFFRIRVHMHDGKIVAFDPYWTGHASTGKTYPVEVEPGVFDFVSNTSIYRFRALSDEEARKIEAALEAYVAIRDSMMHDAPMAGGNSGPLS